MNFHVIINPLSRISLTILTIFNKAIDKLFILSEIQYCVYSRRQY